MAISNIPTDLNKIEKIAEILGDSPFSDYRALGTSWGLSLTQCTEAFYKTVESLSQDKKISRMEEALQQLKA